MTFYRRTVQNIYESAMHTVYTSVHGPPDHQIQHLETYDGCQGGKFMKDGYNESFIDFLLLPLLFFANLSRRR